MLFYPIHEGLGGRIRYFISGGSALSEKIQRDFYLGFTILEGYGLTEASPVLTVTRPRIACSPELSASRCRASKCVSPNPTRAVSAK